VEGGFLFKKPTDAGSSKVRRPVKPIAVNSLFRRMNSLFARKRFSVPFGQGIGRNVLKLLHELMRGRARMAGNMQIPCYFPCKQGIAGSRPIMSPHAIAAANAA
jgi:hypothetical protein